MISQLAKFYDKYKIHLIVWGSFIVYESIISGLISEGFGQLGVYIIVYILNISIFYAHAHFFKKELAQKNLIIKLLTIPATILVGITLYTLLAFFLWNKFDQLNFIKLEKPLELNRVFIASCIYRALYFIGFSIGYVYIKKSFEERKRVEELEKQSLISTIEKQALKHDLVQSQNNYLRSQINPHFLFNTLNFIYNDARKKAPMAADAIMNLAEMMRYALKRPEASEMVPLVEEVEQIEHLINLHRLRTANSINLELKVEGELFGIKFPPLILLTLVENMFKHGNISHSAHTAVITIRSEAGELRITTINMINEVKSKNSHSHHVGIENIENRLNNFYKEDYEFSYYRDDINRYITDIRVKINPAFSGLNLQNQLA